MRRRPTSTLMTTLRLGRVSLVIACALVLVGCGGGASTSTPAGEPVSFQELATSASTSAQATSGRFSFDLAVTFAGGKEPFGVSGEGAFDTTAGRASFAVDMSSVAKLLGGLVAGLGGDGAKSLPDFENPGGWKIEVVTDGNVEYVRFPAIDHELPEGKTWLRGTDGQVEAAGFQELDSFTRTDPRDLLDALKSLDGDVQTVAKEKLRGVETTHYRVVLDPAELARSAAREQGDPAARGLLDQLTTQADVEPVPLDVWIDESGLVRKLSLEASGTGAGATPAGDVSLVFELWDYGEHLAIDVPPASQVVDAAAVHG